MCVHGECLVGHLVGREHAGVCTQSGGSILSPGELLQWPEGRHLHGLVAGRDSMLLPNSQPLPQASHHHHHRRAAATNPAHHCCLSGCTQQDLLALCPH